MCSTSIYFTHTLFFFALFALFPGFLGTYYAVVLRVQVVKTWEREPADSTHGGKGMIRILCHHETPECESCQH